MRCCDAIQGVVAHRVRAGVIGRAEQVVVAIVTEGKRVYCAAGDDPVLAGLAVVVVVGVVDAPCVAVGRGGQAIGQVVGVRRAVVERISHLGLAIRGIVHERRDIAHAVLDAQDVADVVVGRGRHSATRVDLPGHFPLGVVGEGRFLP